METTLVMLITVNIFKLLMTGSNIYKMLTNNLEGKGRARGGVRGRKERGDEKAPRFR